MLITFSSSAHGDITYHSDVALHLLKMMGRDETVPSALYAEDVQAALERLRSALAAAESTAISPSTSSSTPTSEDDDEDERPAVSIASRALPLIELLESAIRAQCPVKWESGG